MNKYKIAVIGCGPRGLAALENLFLELSKGKSDYLEQVLLFDDSKDLGAGKAWNLNQAPTNLINISDHALQNLKGRERIIYNSFVLPSFPSYSKWCKMDTDAQENNSDKDLYPPRLQMGKYLNQRFLNIYKVLNDNDLVIKISATVKSLEIENSRVIIKTKLGKYKVDECLLTVGHQYTKDSKETQEWKNHVENSDANYIHHPYEFNIYNSDFKNETVGIKGLGLSMIDICGMLASGKYGEFQKQQNSDLLKYVPAKDLNLQIVPYSLDGLPPVPKPYGRSIDSYFEPSIQQINTFELAIKNHLAEAKYIKNVDFLLNAFSKVTTEIIIGIEERVTTTNLKDIELQAVISNWLKDSTIHHSSFLDQNLPIRDYMIATVEMAMGKKEFSLDYTITQIWRHFQPRLYRLFAHCELKNEVLEEIIKIDEATKRYSYGPPVESILELIALLDAGILDLRFIKDPAIELVSKGWKFQQKEDAITVSTMINSILASPDLQKTNTPIIKSLINQGLVQKATEGLGILTKPDGTLIPKIDNPYIPIAILGRNAKGSILGADAILECFSPEISDWAKAIITKMR